MNPTVEHLTIGICPQMTQSNADSAWGSQICEDLRNLRMMSERSSRRHKGGLGTEAIVVYGVPGLSLSLDFPPGISQTVNVGDVIGKSGNTSPDPVGPHLYVELRTCKELGAWYFTSPTNTGVNEDPTSVLG
jgi:hypothetical protein